MSGAYYTSEDDEQGGNYNDGRRSASFGRHSSAASDTDYESGGETKEIGGRGCAIIFTEVVSTGYPFYRSAALLFQNLAPSSFLLPDLNSVSLVIVLPYFL